MITLTTATAANTWSDSSTVNAWTTTNYESSTNYIVYGGWAPTIEPEARKSPRPEAALDWLDRRVNEMRVRL